MRSRGATKKVSGERRIGYVPFNHRSQFTCRMKRTCARSWSVLDDSHTRRQVTLADQAQSIPAMCSYRDPGDGRPTEKGLHLSHPQTPSSPFTLGSNAYTTLGPKADHRASPIVHRSEILPPSRRARPQNVGQFMVRFPGFCSHSIQCPRKLG